MLQDSSEGVIRLSCPGKGALLFPPGKSAGFVKEQAAKVFGLGFVLNEKGIAQLSKRILSAGNYNYLRVTIPADKEETREEKGSEPRVVQEPGRCEDLNSLTGAEKEQEDEDWFTAQGHAVRDAARDVLERFIHGCSLSQHANPVAGYLSHDDRQQHLHIE